ncbi:MAG: trigger factor [Bacteroidia bacterium]
MNIQAEYTNPLNAIVNIAIQPEDYKGKVDKELRTYAKRVNVPGFRPGTAPLGMVKRMAGKAIALDTVMQVATDGLFEYIKENSLDILGRPLQTLAFKEDEVTADCNTSINVAFEIGLAPSFELNTDLNPPLVRYSVEVDDATLDAEIEEWRNRHGSSVPADEVIENDWLFGSLALANEAGEVIEGEGAFERMVALSGVRIKKPAFFQPYYGFKVDDKAEMDIFSAFDSEEEMLASNLMNQEAIDAFRGQKTIFTLKRISRTQPAELNGEFFEKVLGEKVETEEEFREKLRVNVTGAYNNESKKVFDFQLRNALLKANSFEMPDDFLKRWLLFEEQQKNEADRKLTDENIEDAYKDYRNSFCWEMIEGKIKKDNPEVLPSRQEIDDAIRLNIQSVIAQTGQYMDEEMVFSNIKKDKEYMERQYSNVLNQKVLNELERIVPFQNDTMLAADFRTKKWDE